LTNLYHHTIASGDFEKLYTRLRKQEGRIYSDTEVACLPDIDETHPYYREWLLRKDSSKKLVEFLKKNKRPLDILEIGCGNGWLSHRLSQIPGCKVIGTDINFGEIEQAARIFCGQSNLSFIYGNAECELFEEKKFDIIIFAASIQYFTSLQKIIQSILKLLKPNGSIHIIDSPFYTIAELAAARQRTHLYYETAGIPEMSYCYFHHILEELEYYNYSTLYDPHSLFNRFLKNKNPFHWICIQS